ncbi:hypothetical protein AB0M34_30090, partial [Nocardia sp. NPDC050193]
GSRGGHPFPGYDTLRLGLASGSYTILLDATPGVPVVLRRPTVLPESSDICGYSACCPAWVDPLMAGCIAVAEEWAIM